MNRHFFQLALCSWPQAQHHQVNESKTITDAILHPLQLLLKQQKGEVWARGQRIGKCCPWIGNSDATIFLTPVLRAALVPDPKDRINSGAQ